MYFQKVAAQTLLFSQKYSNDGVSCRCDWFNHYDWLNAWKIEQTSDERVSGSPSEQPINDQEAKVVKKIEKDFEGSGPPLDIISRGSVVDGKLEVEHPDPSREYLKTLVKCNVS